MRGSLSTYALNVDKVAHMIDGKLMPRSTMELFPSDIAVLDVD